MHVLVHVVCVGSSFFLVSVLIVRMFDLKSCNLGVNYCIGDHHIIFVVFHVGADDLPNPMAWNSSR